MQWHAVIDRFEGDFAVLIHVDEKTKEKTTITIPRKLLPAEIKEGDYLSATWEVDEAATQAARERVTSILNRLINRNQQ